MSTLPLGIVELYLTSDAWEIPFKKQHSRLTGQIAVCDSEKMMPVWWCYQANPYYGKT